MTHWNVSIELDAPGLVPDDVDLLTAALETPTIPLDAVVSFIPKAPLEVSVAIEAAGALEAARRACAEVEHGFVLARLDRKRGELVGIWVRIGSSGEEAT